MKHRILLLSLAIFIAVFTRASAQTRTQPVQAGAPQAPAAKGAIEGTVTRAGGQPLKGARVTIQRGNARQQQNTAAANMIPAELRATLTNLASNAVSVSTDVYGRFTISGLDPGQYRISADREGYLRSEYGQRKPGSPGLPVTLAANQKLSIDIPMSQASVISGRVMTEDGEPASNTSVQAYTYRYSNGGRSLEEVATAQTNDLGEYRLFWLDPGEYFVSVVNDQQGDDTPVGNVDASTTRGGGGRGAAADIASLVGTLLGGRGGLIAEVLGEGTENGPPPIYYPGSIDPDAAAPVAVGPSIEVRGIDFSLRPMRTATVTGRIVAPFPLDTPQGRGRGDTTGGRGRGDAQGFLGAAAGPVQLQFNRIGTSRSGLSGMIGLRLGGGGPRVNSDGTFEIKNVAPGAYNITASGRDATNQDYSARLRVDVGNSDVGNLALNLRLGVEIRGKITLETTPSQQFSMTQLRVSLVSQDSGLPAELLGITAGGRGARGNPGTGTPGAGTQGGAAGQGTQTGQGARGDGTNGGGGGTRGGRGGDILSALGQGGQVSTATVGEDGSFTLQNVGAMEYRVRVTGLPQGAYVQAGRLSSNDALNTPFTVESGEGLLQLQLGFSAGRVTGTVLDERAMPAPGAQVVLVPDESRRGRSETYFTATSGQNGQFTLANVPPGSYKLFSWEEIPSGAYQYADFLRTYENRGQLLTIPPNGTVAADVKLIVS